MPKCGYPLEMVDKGLLEATEKQSTLCNATCIPVCHINSQSRRNRSFANQMVKINAVFSFMAQSGTPMSRCGRC